MDKDRSAMIYGYEGNTIHVDDLGRYHRIDGPALIRSAADCAPRPPLPPLDPFGWYLYGKRFRSFFDWLAESPVDEEQKTLLKLIYG